jgi:hypothetical protein
VQPELAAQVMAAMVAIAGLLIIQQYLPKAELAEMLRLVEQVVWQVLVVLPVAVLEQQNLVVVMAVQVEITLPDKVAPVDHRPELVQMVPAVLLFGQQLQQDHLPPVAVQVVTEAAREAMVPMLLPQVAVAVVPVTGLFLTVRVAMVLRDV